MDDLYWTYKVNTNCDARIAQEQGALQMGSILQNQQAIIAQLAQISIAQAQLNERLNQLDAKVTNVADTALPAVAQEMNVLQSRVANMSRSIVNIDAVLSLPERSDEIKSNLEEKRQPQNNNHQVRDRHYGCWGRVSSCLSSLFWRAPQPADLMGPSCDESSVVAPITHNKSA